MSLLENSTFFFLLALRWQFMSRIASLLLLLLPSILFSQTTPGAIPDLLTLDEAVNLALQNNRTVRISTLEVEKLGQNISAFRTHRLPVMQVSMMGSGLLTPFSFEFQQGAFGTYPGIGPIPAQNKDITTPRQFTGFMMNSVAQPLSQLYKIDLGIRSLEFSRDIGREDLRAKQHEIRDQVTRVYYDLAQTQSALDASLQTIQFYTELDRVTDQFLLRQAVLKADSIDVKMRLAKAQLETVKLRDALETRQEQLNQLMGRDIRLRFRVSPTQSPDSVELDLAVAQNRALEQRPEVRQAALKIKQAEYDRRQKKAEYIPDVSLSVHQMSFLNVDLLPANVLTAGVDLTWEPFDWGRKRHELAAKSETVEQAQTALSETESQILLDVNAQFRKVHEAAAALQVAQLAVDAAEEQLRVASDAYRIQSVRLDQLLQVEAGKSTAASEYQKALSYYWTARADLAKAMGDE
jgi:outer membrane protein